MDDKCIEEKGSQKIIIQVRIITVKVTYPSTYNRYQDRYLIHPVNHQVNQNKQ